MQLRTFETAVAGSTNFPLDASTIQHDADSSHDIKTLVIQRSPIAADDISAILADIAVRKPLDRTSEIASPESIRMNELSRRYLSAIRDLRTVTTAPNARYYGIEVNDQSFTPRAHPQHGQTRFSEWLNQSSSS